MAEELIRPGIHKQKLKALVLPHAPSKVRDCFDFMRSHIVLQSNGMGVSIRESRADLKELMSAYNLEYEVLSGYVDMFEEQLLQSHSDSVAENK